MPLPVMACVLWQVKQLLKESGPCVNDSMAVLDRRSSPARIENGESVPLATRSFVSWSTGIAANV